MQTKKNLKTSKYFRYSIKFKVRSVFVSKLQSASLEFYHTSTQECKFE
jgi:hypothetical protein